MSEQAIGVTAEQLAVDSVKEFKITLGWYGSTQGQKVMSSTDYGRLMFAWEARYENNELLRMYDEITFSRVMKDPDFIPAIDKIISIREVDMDRVVQLCLYPIAFTRVNCPWFQKEFRVTARAGEHCIHQCEVDQNMTLGRTIKRTVIGIKTADGKKTFLIISPSGVVLVSNSVDVSNEGE